MHVLELPLKTTKYDNEQIDRRFHALSRVHNQLVSHARNLMNRLDQDREYQNWREEYRRLSGKKKLSENDKARKKELGALMSQRREDMGLTQAGFESYIKVYRSQFQKLLSSQQVQKEAARVWKSVDSCLFGDGKQVHFKKYEQFSTIGGKSNQNGAKVSIGLDKNGSSVPVVQWLGLEMECALPKKEKELAYVRESLDHTVKYCEIKRRQFEDKWKYYAILVLDGEAPQKLIPGKKDVGVDQGTSTMAAVSHGGCFLEELAPNAAKCEKEITDLQRKMEDSKRATNLDKYNEDGTVKKGNHGRWVYSSHYRHLRRRMRTLHRKKSEYTLHSHRAQCNRIIRAGNVVITEKMDYRALARRSKKTERQEKATEIRQKDGTVKTVRKYKKKKRFGHSIVSRSPARFMSELKRKCLQYGGAFYEVDTVKYRASQYDHVTGEYIKVPLSQRTKEVGGRVVQRDLYSGFLIMNTADDLTHPDREKCIREFEWFVKAQDALIEEMKASGRSMKHCFGF